MTTHKKDWVLLPHLTLTDRQLFDLEQILVGGFAPLIGFMEEADYTSSLTTMKLSSGEVWPIPVVLDVPHEHGYSLGNRIVLTDIQNNPVAILTVKSIYSPDKNLEARLVYGTEDSAHSGVRYLLENTRPVYIGGPVEKITRPSLDTFDGLYCTPDELKEKLSTAGHVQVVAFQTRNPMHKAHVEIIQRAKKKTGAHILIHPVVGLTKEGDVDPETRVRTYKRLHEIYLRGIADLAVLPLAMRMAGPREALWHALIRKNYGATHFIVGRDHAGPGNNKQGIPFYEPYDAQKLVAMFADTIGIQMVPMEEVVYVEELDTYMPLGEVPEGKATCSISGTQLRNMIASGKEIPAWFSYPEVIEELRAASQRKKGVAIFFTGLSGAGKSTLASVLKHKLERTHNRTVSLLDGDVVRANLSKELGFSKKDRITNITRIGFVAGEIVRHGGMVLCAAVAPYEEARAQNRKYLEALGTYIEVFLSTPIEVCKERDCKGLYAKAEKGELPNLTGVNDPYEKPSQPEITVDTSLVSTEDAADLIIQILKDRSLILQ